MEGNTINFQSSDIDKTLAQNQQNYFAESHNNSNHDKQKKLRIILTISVIILIIIIAVTSFFIFKKYSNPNSNSNSEEPSQSTNPEQTSSNYSEEKTARTANINDEILRKVSQAKQARREQNCEKAIEILSSDWSSYSTEEQSYVYSEAMGVSIDCENQDAYQEFSDLYQAHSDQTRGYGG